MIAATGEVPLEAGDRALLATPRFAWATLALSVLSIALWAVALCSLARGWLPWYVCVALNTAAAFASFTPMHEASHRALARSRALNEAFGRLAAIPLFAPFGAFRYLHLEHHKFTNEPDRDPDHWVSLGPSWQRPLRWLTMDVPYYSIYRKRVRTAGLVERMEFWAPLPLVVGLALATGSGRVMLLGWVLPAKIAKFLLAYVFDYLPHRPHTIPARVDRFRATIVQSNAWRTPVLLYQNYHLIHHLYPAVPFYRYSRVWRAQREMLLASGAVDTNAPRS